MNENFLNVNINRTRRSGKFQLGGSRDHAFLSDVDSFKQGIPYGGTLRYAPWAGGRILKGDFGFYDVDTARIDHLEQFVIMSDYTALDTSIYVAKTDATHTPFVGYVLTIEPDSTNTEGTGKVATVTAVESTIASVNGKTEDVYKLTVTGDLEDCSAGVVLVRADGTTKKPLITEVNVIFNAPHNSIGDYSSTDFDMGSVSASIAPLMHCQVYRKWVTVPKIAEKLNKCNISTIFEL